jgi:hypothetical protein
VYFSARVLQTTQRTLDPRQCHEHSYSLRNSTGHTQCTVPTLCNCSVAQRRWLCWPKIALSLRSGLHCGKVWLDPGEPAPRTKMRRSDSTGTYVAPHARRATPQEDRSRVDHSLNEPSTFVRLFGTYSTRSISQRLEGHTWGREMYLCEIQEGQRKRPSARVHPLLFPVPSTAGHFPIIRNLFADAERLSVLIKVEKGVVKSGTRLTQPGQRASLRSVQRSISLGRCIFDFAQAAKITGGFSPPISHLPQARFSRK